MKGKYGFESKDIAEAQAAQLNARNDGNRYVTQADESGPIQESTSYTCTCGHPLMLHAVKVKEIWVHKQGRCHMKGCVCARVTLPHERGEQ
jgi:hypothetical protein